MRLKAILINMLLDYESNYEKIKTFAEDYEITIQEANILLTAGRNLRENEGRTENAIVDPE